MHFPTSYSDISYLNSTGGVMVDNPTLSWPLLATTMAGQPLVTAAPPPQTVYAANITNMCGSTAFTRPSPYQFTAPAMESEMLPAQSATAIPYYPDESSPSVCRSPVPSSPSFCESVTDSPAPSTPSSQAVDASLRNFVEYRNAVVANIPSTARAEVEQSVEEQLGKIKPLLRKVSTTAVLCIDVMPTTITLLKQTTIASVPIACIMGGRALDIACVTNSSEICKDLLLLVSCPGIIKVIKTLFVCFLCHLQPIDTTGMNDRQVKRIHKRRERNKVAAEKCRIKRREKSGQIRQEMSVLTRSNEELEQEVIRLRNEMQSLQQMLCTHQCSIGHSKEELSQMVADVVGSGSS